MKADLQKIDDLLRFALLAAGEADDYRERQLGPIHLIKYVYLADLAFAKRNEGQSYTGVPWQFYHFGPWSAAVHQQIEPALARIGADRRAMPADYGDRDEWVRWSISREDLVREYERTLPSVIVMTTRACVRKFGADTPSLLEHVYRTDPMRNAAPLEFLDFSLAYRPKQKQVPEAQHSPAAISAKQAKKIKEKFAALREMAQQGNANRHLVNPAPEARYDAVYADGVAWLDELAGEPFKEGESVLEFDSSVWKSKTRTEHDPT